MHGTGDGVKKKGKEEGRTDAPKCGRRKELLRPREDDCSKKAGCEN